ncbi:hypothetical protein AVEN_220033-1 [Araneus ventricosus]|uniref:Uncharacterized protein n=1 Tax=Araneus ventricosus TaxID=182803 RepID=A0A4Y2CQF4_ARAVE|nr:hypothetical protein AVEN_220033-1 [Araneus ventricosus]
MHFSHFRFHCPKYTLEVLRRQALQLSRCFISQCFHIVPIISPRLIFHFWNKKKLQGTKRNVLGGLFRLVIELRNLWTLSAEYAELNDEFCTQFSQPQMYRIDDFPRFAFSENMRKVNRRSERTRDITHSMFSLKYELDGRSDHASSFQSSWP